MHFLWRRSSRVTAAVGTNQRCCIDGAGPAGAECVEVGHQGVAIASKQAKLTAGCVLKKRAATGFATSDLGVEGTEQRIGD